MADAPYLPVRDHDAPAEEVPTVLIFTIQNDDGSTFEKRIPNKVRPSLTWGYLRRIRNEGAMAAEAWMVEQVIGDDGMEALENYEDLTPELNDAITARIRDVTMGGAQAPKA